MAVDSPFAPVRALLADAIARDLFTCASVAVGSSRANIWQEAFGVLAPGEDAPAASSRTWFDLASLTKPLATTGVLMDLASRGEVSLDEPIGRSFPAWRGDDRQDVTVADLLEHASGLAARLPGASRVPGDRDGFTQAICTTPLAHAPRTHALYSDLGFILLGILAEDLDGSSLDVLFERLVLPLAERTPEARDMSYRVPPEYLERTAITRPLPEDTRERPILIGEVHDNYAAALNGVAGHAGLFGTAPAVAALAGALLRGARGVPEHSGAFSVPMIRRAIQPSTVPGSSRALGWDLMRPTSSCGERMSGSAFGHVGFTGTSLWIDPVRDRYYVLLTNRVGAEGTVEEMRDIRRAFHDLLAGV